jgi:hypothetical protein
MGASAGAEALSRPPHVPPQQIPDLPVDTVLHLRAGEWSHLHDVPPDAYVDIRLVKIDKGITRHEDGYVWVWCRGHDPMTCHWESVEPHKPCIEMMVRLDVLVRHAG